VLIVGARCAGATLATFLAGAGARVILLDKDALPGDQVVSTHFISASGMDVLDTIGVGDDVRSVAPPARILRLNVEGNFIDTELPAGRAHYCPRRQRLDGLLQQAAVRAGAALRDRTRVIRLIHEHGRIVGARTERRGREATLTAGLVVGADGRHSTVARLVGAEEYLGYDARRAGYWAYWDVPSFWRADPAYGFDLYFSHAGGETGVIFPTDHGQLLMGSWPPVERSAAWRAAPMRELYRALGPEPLIGPLIRSGPPASRVIGTVKERYFFRTGAGPGWVLVGDAGHHKDFVIGDGITEALRQARSLASAIAEGSDAALARWWRARDVEALPWYFLGKEAGAPGPLSEFHRLLLMRLDADPDLKRRLVEALDRRQWPTGIVPARRALAWVFAAALRERPRALLELLAMATRIAAMAGELRERRRMLAASEMQEVHRAPARAPARSRAGR